MIKMESLLVEWTLIRKVLERYRLPDDRTGTWLRNQLDSKEGRFYSV